VQTQQTLLDNLAELFVLGEYRLLIVDSVISLFKCDFQGRGELSERQQLLQRFLHTCNKLASGTSPRYIYPFLIWLEFNLVVFLVSCSHSRRMTLIR
jgi:meiotic recombination protein DMC1